MKLAHVVIGFFAVTLVSSCRAPDPFSPLSPTDIKGSPWERMVIRIKDTTGQPLNNATVYAGSKPHTEYRVGSIPVRKTDSRGRVTVYCTTNMPFLWISASGFNDVSVDFRQLASNRTVTLEPRNKNETPEHQFRHVPK